MARKIGLILVLLIISVLLFSGAGREAVVDLSSQFRELGAPGAVFFVFAYVVAAVLLVPGAALTLVAGGVYGLGLGITYVMIASVLGAALPFLITRHFARYAVMKRFGHDPRVRAIDDAVDREGWRIVALTRLSPLLPYNILNYALGLSKISFRQYIVWSWLGMIPGTILYVYIGAAAGRIAGSSQAVSSKAETFAFWFGIVATAVLTIYISRLTNRALKQATADSEQ